MKLKKSQKRLNARIRDWESIKADETIKKGKFSRKSGKFIEFPNAAYKVVSKSGFTRPGSNKK